MLSAVFQGMDNVNKNVLLEYVMMNSVFETLMQVCYHNLNTHTQAHAIMLTLTHTHTRIQDRLHIKTDQYLL